MDQFQKYVAEYKKHYTKEYIHCRSSFIWRSGTGQNNVPWKDMRTVVAFEGGEGCDFLKRNMRKLSRVMVMFCILTGVELHRHMVRICQLVHLRVVHFIVCKFYVKRKKKWTIKIYWTQINDMHAKLLG